MWGFVVELLGVFLYSGRGVLVGSFTLGWGVFVNFDCSLVSLFIIIFLVVFWVRVVF